MKVFDLFYTLLAVILFIAAFPFLLLLSFKKKYRHSIPARFFLWKNPSFKPHDIWFHVCSLGEAKAIAPLIELLGDTKVAITTITHTGYEAALKYPAQVRYLPYEFWLWLWIRAPKMVVVLEAEFWYLLFRITHARGAHVIALNARISERSFGKYYKMRWFYKRLLTQCDRIFCQSNEDMVRFIALGATNVEVLGNIKLAQKIAATREYAKPEGTLIVAASTHEGEEEPIIRGFLAYKKSDPHAKLLVVPRHPERFEKVFGLIQKTAPTMTLSRWSQSTELSADITLINAMGELNNLYAISDVAILGGAFAPVGGHNPLEPAHFGCKIITGEHIFSQRELLKYVHHVQFVAPEDIDKALANAQTLPPSRVDETIGIERIVDYLKTEIQA